jgi:hypothetical protein
MRISVLLPTSLAADLPDLMQKTIKIGQIGRALAIFRVDDVWIYNDGDPRIKNQAKERELICTILRYMETPQYLRKLLFPKSPLLKYAGLLPPLRTPHHPRAGEKNIRGSFRDGVVVEVEGDRSVVEIGLKKKAIVRAKLERGRRVTVRIVDTREDAYQAKIVSPTSTGEYWGYRVHVAESLPSAVRSTKSDLTLGTSRTGSPLYGVIEKIKNSRALAVAFGGPYAGIHEICRRQGCAASQVFDAVVNTIPKQGVATVRTEEALIATLALLNQLVRG